MRPIDETSTMQESAQPLTKKTFEQNLKKKLYKPEEKEPSINTQNSSNITLKKEDAMNNIRFKGIFERNPLDKTTPYVFIYITSNKS
jgi:hypothetical protein